MIYFLLTIIFLLIAYIVSLHVEIGDKKETIKTQHNRINEALKLDLRAISRMESMEELITDLRSRNASLARANTAMKKQLENKPDTNEEV